MRNTLKTLIVLGTLMANTVFAQHAEPALAKAHYLFKHVNDTTQREQFRRDEMVLYLGQTSSYFTSYSANRAQEEIKKQVNDPAFDGNLTLTQTTSTTRESYYLRPQQPLAIEIMMVANDKFQLEMTVPKPDWKMVDETRDIGGYTCQRAEVDYKGRHYIVWFSTEIPFPYGPWKLQGLPGLILEAYDDKKEVVFQYSGFDKIDEGQFNVELPIDAVKSSVKEVKKLESAYLANPQAYMQAKQAQMQNKASGKNAISVSSSSSKGTDGIDTSKIKSMHIIQDENYKPSKITNNPIELIP
jgi:GLPGLI family protein